MNSAIQKFFSFGWCPPPERLMIAPGVYIDGLESPYTPEDDAFGAALVEYMKSKIDQEDFEGIKSFCEELCNLPESYTLMDAAEYVRERMGGNDDRPDI